MNLLITMLRKIANFTVVGVVDMINNKLRDYIAEEHEESAIFNIPSYDNSIVGITDDGHIVYDYDLMVKEFMSENTVNMKDAIEFIEYNTLRTLPYIEEAVRPIIMFSSEIIKEIKA